MDRPIHIYDGTLRWSGEHWIAGLQRAGETRPSAWVSLFHTRYSPAGEGNTAHVLIPDDKINLICTDNPAEAERLLRDNFAHSIYYTSGIPIVGATFARGGDVRRDPSWSIAWAGHQVIATWQVTEPPVMAEGTFRSGTAHFTLLFFTDEATVALDGDSVEGHPYPRDIWQPTIGGSRSSCVFALAETVIEG